MSRRIGDTTMLFKPLAYASTLDRCGVTAAARLRGGVLEPGALLPTRNVQAKAAVTRTAPFTAFRRMRTFLSQAGPRFSSRSSSSWTSPRCGRSFPLERRRRPSRVALASSCYAATRLAGAPPSEGLVVVGPQEAGRLLPARRAGRDIGRGRGKGFDVDVAHLHGPFSCADGR